MLHFIVYDARLNYDDLLETENSNSDKKQNIYYISPDNHNLE